MNFWLIKSEPSVYSLADLKRDKKTFWDGVRNYQAAGYMRQMKSGDKCFFYHSNEGMAIVGIARVVKEFYQDGEEGKFGRVDVGYDKAFRKPVTLAEIKARKQLVDIGLVKQSRLSVMPIRQKHWEIINEMAI